MTDSASRDAELGQLLSRVADSDQQAFQRLYKLASPVVYGVLLRMFNHDYMAEDALQETFVRIWQKADTYDHSQGKPLTWMTSIARYHALDVLRSQSSRSARDTDYAIESERCNDTLQTLHNQIDDGQLLSICLERLEPEARNCVIHAFCGGYSHQELSDITGRALGTVKSWIKRSLSSLKACINELS